MLENKEEIMKRTLYRNVNKIHLHNYLTDKIARTLLEMGYDNESIIISQKIVIKDYDKASVETTIDILPVYRLKTTKTDLEDIVNDANIMIEKEWEGYR